MEHEAQPFCAVLPENVGAHAKYLQSPEKELLQRFVDVD